MGKLDLSPQRQRRKGARRCLRGWLSIGAIAKEFSSQVSFNSLVLPHWELHSPAAALAACF
jgi:hypothetical protein